jgi:DNA-binding NarL/FixJ family response regulator
VVAAVIYPEQGVDPDQLILASPDRAWCQAIEAALADNGAGLNLRPQRVDSFEQLTELLRLPSRLWLVDEAWLAPALAQRRVAAWSRKASPDLIVRFANGADANVVAVIEMGARGCLSHNADIEEVLRAVRAVLDGELWVSRRVYARVLNNLLDRHVAKVVVDEEGDGLTGRQSEIAACVARGMSNKQIARHLGISPTTVKTHLHNIFERMGVSGRTLLALRAAESDGH